MKNTNGKLEIVDGILSRFKSCVTKIDIRARRATVELSICGEKKEVQLGIRLPESQEESPAEETRPDGEEVNPAEEVQPDGEEVSG